MFVNHPSMAEIRQRSIFVHVNVPGQEDNATDFPAEYVFLYCGSGLNGLVYELPVRCRFPKQWRYSWNSTQRKNLSLISGERKLISGPLNSQTPETITSPSFPRTCSQIVGVSMIGHLVVVYCVFDWTIFDILKYNYLGWAWCATQLDRTFTPVSWFEGIGSMWWWEGKPCGVG